MPRRPTDAPGWLAHPLRWQRGPVPWPAVLRGALGMGPVFALGLAGGHGRTAVLGGLGAMFATINDRPGTWRSGAVTIVLPALAGALGLLLGQESGWRAVPVLAAVGLVSGAISVAGPVWSLAGLQLLVLTAVGSGTAPPAPGWPGAGAFLAGAAWPLLLRVLLRRPSGGRGRDERAAVADVFDALADALDAVGTAGAEPARRRLTATLDRADEALRLSAVLRLSVVLRPAAVLRLRTLLRRPGPIGGSRRPAGPPDVRPAARLDAAAALCEAAVALLWEGAPLPPRIGAGPRRLAEATRRDTLPGRLPAPVSDTAARSAFDRAVLDAGLAFVADSPAAPRPVRRPPVRPAGPAGRAYGLRVSACVTVSTAVALLLHADHWYWLPATAAFLVKPELGPLFSRTVSRFAGTALAVLAFAPLAPLLTGPWLPALTVTAAGALIPLALRHFAAQTAVVTVTVLAFVSAGGDREAAGSRLVDTAIACALVLLVGHLPRLADSQVRVGHRSAHALRHTRRYLDHVLADSRADDRADGPADAPAAAGQRAALRRAAYGSLAEARAAAETAAAEFRTGGGRDWLRVTAGAERIVDAATACAVRLEHGAARPAAPAARQVADALDAVADALELPEAGPRRLPAIGAPPEDCRTLHDIVAELHRIRDLTTAA
ncbi:FUSC family protein [Kitasatospora paranensis]|uniref:FUSC family protein n=2 Tax=Kitasatospora paranensis TaxID=258053 RepID=UPI0036072749